MSAPDNGVLDTERLCHAFYDISQLLASAESSEARVLRVLERFRSIVHYDSCAVLLVLPGTEPRLIAAPGTSVDERIELHATTTALMSRFVADRGQAQPAALPSGTHLAVPMIGLDDAIGMLFVRALDRAYEARHVRRLSVVAANLASYFSMLHAVLLQKERTLQLEKARAAAESANRVKDEFLAIVSHELRTPLGGILGWADALRSVDLDETERTRAVEAIERGVRTEAKLIEDLLDLSRLRSAELRLQLESVPPVSVIEAALSSLDARAKQKAIRLDATLDPAATPVLVDPQRFRQIVLNLVANAIKFTPAGGRVEVRLERAGASARLKVIDTGAGIPPEQLPSLFLPFRQADSSSTRRHGGLGVGLCLVKDLVELHGGTVHAESPGENRGATFSVELPLVDAAPSSAPAAETASDGQRRGGTLAGLRVLLVDDDRDIGEVLQYLLEAEGALVTVATSAAEAMRSLERSMPSVLLSDLSMPGETGHDLMRQVQARAGARSPPAVALSSGRRGSDLAQALASGFRMLLEKPIDTTALITAVASLARSAGENALQKVRGEP